MAFITLLNLDFVLFEPARSADPPIKLFLNLNNEFKTDSEDFLVANGFKFENQYDGSWNRNATKFIYLAFAEAPFKNARAR